MLRARFVFRLRARHVAVPLSPPGCHSRESGNPAFPQRNAVRWIPALAAAVRERDWGSGVMSGWSGANRLFSGGRTRKWSRARDLADGISPAFLQTDLAARIKAMWRGMNGRYAMLQQLGRCREHLCPAASSVACSARQARPGTPLRIIMNCLGSRQDMRAFMAARRGRGHLQPLAIARRSRRPAQILPFPGARRPASRTALMHGGAPDHAQDTADRCPIALNVRTHGLKMHVVYDPDADHPTPDRH